MLETLYSAIAVFCYFTCAMRILCFDSNHVQPNVVYKSMAVVLIAAFMAQSVNILCFKNPVTALDGFFSIILMFIVLGAKGNVSLIFRSKWS